MEQQAQAAEQTHEEMMSSIVRALRQRTLRKKGVKCIPLPIGSFLKEDTANMRFGKIETARSLDSLESAHHPSQKLP